MPTSFPHAATAAATAAPAAAPRDDLPRGDKLLFTPGPLTTSRTVKEATLRDLGSRDLAFIGLVREVRARLLALAGVSPAEYAAVIVQGSGTFAVEAAITTAVPVDGKLLVCSNGAYGKRMLEIARAQRIPATAVTASEDRPIDPAAVDAALAADPAVTHVACVHLETTTGLLNPVAEIGRVVARRDREVIVDAMSAFGAVPLDLGGARVGWLVSSANKILEGVPGFAFAIARQDALRAAEGRARSLSLDLCAQWRELERSGQFRFTPPRTRSSRSGRRSSSTRPRAASRAAPRATGRTTRRCSPACAASGSSRTSRRTCRAS